jgi:hypothetical protein
MEWAAEKNTVYPPRTVTVDVIERSILFVDKYLTPMADRFFGEADKRSPEDIAAAIVANFIKAGQLQPRFNAQGHPASSSQ